MKKNFSSMSEKEVMLLNTATLAYIGDCIYELMVRKRIIELNCYLPISKLHELTVEKVNASSQALAYDYIEKNLLDKDREIIKRGRNNNSNHCPKNFNPIEYKKATGLETLFGYWYLLNNDDMLLTYFDKIFDFLENSDVVSINKYKK